MATSLSITDPNCILHKYQQVIAYGRHKKNRPRLVAALEASICPSKAKIQIVFKKYKELPESVQQDLLGRFHTEVKEIDSGSKALHLISFALQSRTGLSQEDMHLSLTRTSENDYQFPLVKSLEYDIKTAYGKDDLSNNEREVVGMIQEIVESRIPNSTISEESITTVGESRGNDVSEITRSPRRRTIKRAETTSICNTKLLIIGAVLGLLVAQVLISSDYAKELLYA